ncbi:hypothetical protein [Knoellia aerolata]|uniref:Uncharacterized protein n=1 Tax=Knoellia aerolata DSM 18566 TaxID=1385519 RepID=A0A0A0JWI5_9MICO|nr:hypothetical protein [Knoellia aerolata]KGN41009.1 hypothetical protein N801_10015 [Knoellia aerolata DSM 18566]
MSGRDRRSVGELLAECDLSTRGLLINPDALDAAAMVRAWPEVVQAAHELLGALPTAQRVIRPGEGGADLTVERLHLMATAIDTNLRHRDWPGEGPADDMLLTVAGNLMRAHDLVHRHLRGTSTPAPAVVADATAARTRVLHTLYVGSHAIALAVRAQVRDVQVRDARARPDGVSARQRRTQLTALRFVLTRLAAFEQVAGAEVYRYFPVATKGEHREAPAPDRLRTALAGWDVEAHRTLAAAPSMANLTELTRVQTTALAVTRVVLHAAAVHHAIDPHMHQAHLEPSLTAAESAWGTLHGTLRDLTGHAHRAVHPHLRTAGAELVHALSELVLDGTAVADPDTIAARTDLTAAARTLTGALESPHQSSLLLLDAALDPRTRVNARGAHHLLTRLVAVPGAGVLASPLDAWVDPADLTACRDVAPPAPIREAITRQIHTVGGTSQALAAASTAVTTPPIAAVPDASTRTPPQVARSLHLTGPAPQRAAGHVPR